MQYVNICNNFIIIAILTANFIFSRIYVGFSVPILPYYKDGKFEYGSFARKVDVIHSESPYRENPDIVTRDKREFDKISKQMQEIGFELKSPIDTAIPNTEKMYDIIDQKINSEIDKLEEIANI